MVVHCDCLLFKGHCAGGNRLAEMCFQRLEAAATGIGRLKMKRRVETVRREIIEFIGLLIISNATARG